MALVVKHVENALKNDSDPRAWKMAEAWMRQAEWVVKNGG